MKIKQLNLVKGVLLLLAFAAVLMPTEVFAAADIFDTIQAKMLSTAKDVRKIVYVVSGFGLVMFSVLAIFNKISFKHLGYIMISLSLLAMMTPFINYFSGAGLDESDFNYGDFIIESSDSSGYSNASQQQSCEPNCPSSENIASNDTDLFGNDEQGGEAGNGFGLSEEGGESGNGSSEGSSSGTVPGTQSPGSSAGTGGGLDIPPTYDNQTADNQTAGQEKEKKTAKEKLRDALNWGQGAVNTVNNAIDTYESTKSGVETVAGGLKQVGDILGGDGNVLEKLNDLSSAVSSTVDTSGDWFGRAATEGGSVLDALGSNTATDVAGGIVDDIEDAQNESNDWTNMGSDAAGIGRGAQNIGRRLGL